MRMPLPSFSWAKGADVWNCMLEKDAHYTKLRNDKMLLRHPSLVASYRTILFDWLSEVSHECKFHRETYHLALDLIDRYLAAAINVGKLQLQLIGTTCLFLAAKIEEIRPPTVNEFADLTDGACKAQEILDNEVVILSAINWDMTPMTPNNWLSVYMQILLNLDKEPNNDSSSSQSINHQSSSSSASPDDHDHHTNLTVVDENSQSLESSSQPANETAKNDSFIIPSNNGVLIASHKRIASVIDLAMLHIQSLRFSNSVLTASALYHFTDELTVRQCTGYDYKDLHKCVQWLKPFVDIIKEIREPVFLATNEGESHTTQMHNHIATAKLLEKVTQKMESYEASTVTSTTATPRGLKRKAQPIINGDVPQTSHDILSLSPTGPDFLPTPPHSAEKRRPRQAV